MLHIYYVLLTHTCFSGSVKTWAASIENGLEIAIYKIKEQNTSHVLSGSKGTILILVVYLCLRGIYRRFFGSVRDFSEALWALSPKPDIEKALKLLKDHLKFFSGQVGLSTKGAES